MGGGAWPFLVGGVICLVNSDNERDSVLLNRLFLLLGRGAVRVGSSLLAVPAHSGNYEFLLRGTGDY